LQSQKAAPDGARTTDCTDFTSEKQALQTRKSETTQRRPFKNLTLDPEPVRNSSSIEVLHKAEFAISERKKFVQTTKHIGTRPEYFFTHSNFI
jgi:hypothetical protein